MLTSNKNIRILTSRKKKKRRFSKNKPYWWGRAPYSFYIPLSFSFTTTTYVNDLFCITPLESEEERFINKLKNYFDRTYIY